MTDCMDRLCDIKCELVDILTEHTNAGLENVDTAEMGEVVDMVKDIFEAEKDCAKAGYYKAVTEAMESSDRRMGYIPEPEPMERYERYMDTRWDEDTRNRPVREYKAARRYYTPTDDSVDDVIFSIKELWDDADADLRKKLKTQLSALINEMA